MAKVQFFKGTYTQITSLSSREADGIYFATDRPYIFVGSQEIGIDGSIVKDFEWVDASNALKVSYKDGSEKVVVIPIATSDKNGLMSKEDFAKLAAIDSSWFGTGHVQTDRIVWSTEIADMATKSDVSTAVADKLDASGVIAILDASLAPYAKTEDISAGYVHAESGKRLMTDAEGTKLAGIAEGAEANLVDGVDASDNILSLSNKKISATLAINYDSSAKKIQLTGKDGSVFSEFSAEEFIKDGILYGTAMGKSNNDGELTVTIREQTKTLTGLTPNHQHLVLCFSTYDLQTEAFKYDWHAIDVEALIDVYNAGPGISIDDNNNISVNVAEDTSVNKNFLDMEGDASLAVRSVDADCTITVSSAEVVGGPLAGAIDANAWPADWYEDGKKVIPADKSVQEILTGLFLKENNGTLGTTVYIWNPTNSAPSVSFGKSGLVEVGTEVTMSLVSNQTVNNNTHSVSCTATGTGMYGYFDTEAHKNQNYSQSVNCTSSGIAVVDGTWSAGGTESSVGNGSKKNIVPGLNKLTGNQHGITASCVDLTPTTIYALTNTGKKVNSVSVAITADSRADKALVNSASSECTGVWPVYTNRNNIDGALVKEALADSTSFEFDYATELGKTHYIRFAYPATHTLSAYYCYNTMSKAWEQQTIVSGQVKASEITVAGQAYNEFEKIAENRSGAAKWKFVLNKKTSQN